MTIDPSRIVYSTNEGCFQVAAWLSGGSAAGSAAPDQLIDHVRGCPRCRGALPMLIASLAGQLATPVDAPCTIVADQIPALVDCERERGLIAAVQVFPDIWWHTLICRECAELYIALRTLADLPHEPWQAAGTLFQPPAVLQLRLRTRVVRQFIAAEQRLGVAWSGQSRDSFVAAQEGEIGRLTLFVRRNGPAEVVLVVRSEPALAGTALLTTAGATYRAAFDQSGSALFSDLDAAQLSDDADDDLIVTVAISTARD